MLSENNKQFFYVGYCYSPVESTPTTKCTDFWRIAYCDSEYQLHKAEWSS